MDSEGAHMSAASVASPPISGTAPARWIISKRDDLTWFIGSSTVSYLVLACLMAGAPLLPFQFLWFFCLDGPHVVATVTRTYCDQEARRRLRLLLWIPLPLLLVGPAMVWMGLATLFLLLAVCWQHFHIVKQHFRFVMLYKAKNGEMGRLDYWLDRWFLVGSLVLPLGIFVSETRGSFELFQSLPWAMGAYAALTLAWIGRQVFKWRTGATLNGPKLALIGAVVPLQWFALLHAAQFGPKGILRAAIVLGTFHSFQYHRLLWFHNHNRYSAEGSHSRFGLAANLASSVAVYMAAAAGLNVLLNFLPGLLFARHAETVQVVLWGISFTHYCLDARIWDVRGDRELAMALRMA
jgi:hypothetical protein